MVSDPFLVGVFFGIVPAMATLYILLKEFQPFYEEKRLFRAFFLGMAVGLLITIGEFFVGPKPEAQEGGPWAALAVYAALFALLEVGAFAVVLNSRRYRAKRDTPYYAVGFGLGFGATNVLFLVGNLVTRLQTRPAGVAEAVFLAVIGLYFIGSILVHAAVGAWVGLGTSRGPLFPNLALAALVRTGYVAGFYVMYRSSSPFVSFALPFLGAAAGVALVAWVLRALSRIVPQEVLREMEVHKRRVARRASELAEETAAPPEPKDP